jgi:molecular chaperone IbpA
MRGNFDFTPYRRSTVGFDRLFDFLENAARTEQSDNYPPFDIEKLGDDRYRITLAVAGFRKDEIEITARQNLLTITGRKSDSRAKEGNFLHVGIATRAFERRFELADFVRVGAAELQDGLLAIELVREIPDAMKPRKVEIGSGAGRTVEAQSHRSSEAEAAQEDRETEAAA